MADETVTTDKPLANLANAEREIDTRDAKTAELHSETHGQSITTTDEHTPAAERLRAYEDEVVGTDAVRINGAIERGYGSRFKDLPVAKQRKHAALERLVVAEQKVADAHAALAVAESDQATVERDIERADADIEAEPAGGDVA